MSPKLEELNEEMLTTLALTIRGWRKVNMGSEVVWYDESNTARRPGFAAFPLTNPHDFSNYRFWAEDKYGMVITVRTEMGMVSARACIRTPKFLVGQCSMPYEGRSHIGLDRVERRVVITAIIKAISQETIDNFKTQMVPLKFP
jgi:hypothetical protein